MKFIYLFFCFLIISCDLPNEADVDCNGISGGTALVDSCGVCSEGDTGLTANADITECGDCFDYSCYEYQCNDSQAINYHEVSNPELIDHSRKKRISKGSGTSLDDVNQLMKQFSQMNKMMRMMQTMGSDKMMQMMQNAKK